jgi:hypothetical protein
MSYTPGTMLRNGFTDTAVVLKDGSIFELKRAGRRLYASDRRTFSDVAAWRASLNVDTTTEIVSVPKTSVTNAPKVSLTSRVFQYTADVPHSEIALDLLKHFKSRTDCRVDSLKIWQQEMVKVKIALLKLELDPPEIDPEIFGSSCIPSVDTAKHYYRRWTNLCTTRIAEYSKLPSSTVYCPTIAYFTPKVFVKIGNEMVPLAVHEESGHVVLNRTGYKKFADAAPCGPDGLPEFWALSNKKMTKLDVSISDGYYSYERTLTSGSRFVGVPSVDVASQPREVVVPEPCTMLPFEYRGVTYMRVGRERDNFWSSGDLWQNNNGVKGAYVGCLQQDGGINESAESAVWERARGAQWQ